MSMPAIATIGQYISIANRAAINIGQCNANKQYSSEKCLLQSGLVPQIFSDPSDINFLYPVNLQRRWHSCDRRTLSAAARAVHVVCVLAGSWQKCQDRLTLLINKQLISHQTTGRVLEALCYSLRYANYAHAHFYSGDGIKFHSYYIQCLPI